MNTNCDDFHCDETFVGHLSVETSPKKKTSKKCNLFSIFIYILSSMNFGPGCCVCVRGNYLTIMAPFIGVSTLLRDDDSRYSIWPIVYRYRNQIVDCPLNPIFCFIHCSLSIWAKRFYFSVIHSQLYLNVIHLDYSVIRSLYHSFSLFFTPSHSFLQTTAFNSPRNSPIAHLMLSLSILNGTQINLSFLCFGSLCGNAHLFSVFFSSKVQLCNTELPLMMTSVLPFLLCL